MTFPRAAAFRLVMVLYFVALAGFYFPFTLSPDTGGHGDAAVYALMARYFSLWSTGSSPAVVHVMTQSVFPPLYPMLLGLVGGAERLVVAHAATVGCLLAAMAVYFAWVRTQGIGRGQSLALVSAFALLPGTLMLSLELVSEHLYLLLSLAHFAAFSKADSAAHGRERTNWLYLAAVLAGLALVTRTIGVALLAAFALSVLLRKMDRRWYSIALALLPVSAWLCVKWRLGFVGGYEDTYWERLANLSSNPWEAVLLGARGQLQAIFSTWASLFSLQRDGGLDEGLAIGVGILAIIGWIQRLRRLRADAIYVTLYLGIVCAWPFPDYTQRFVFPLFPYLLFYALDALTPVAHTVGPSSISAMRGVFNRRWGTRLLQSGLLATIVLGPLPALSHIVERYHDASGKEYEAYTHTARWFTRRDLEDAGFDARLRQSLVQSLRGLASSVPEGECVLFIKPPDLMLHAGRLSYKPPPPQTYGATFRALAGKCRYLYLTSLTRGAFVEPLYPYRRLATELDLLEVHRTGDSSDDFVVGILAKRKVAAEPP